jgi:hypothetical protein
MARKRAPKLFALTLVSLLVSAGCTTMVRSSAPPGGGPGNGQSEGARGPALSDDGRYVVFRSFASDLVPGDTNGFPDAFRRDNVTGETIRVSVKNDGSQIPFTSTPEAISGDGTHVLFVTSASLEAADTNENFDAYVRNIPAGTTERVSIRPDGSPINPDSDLFPAIRSASLSDDGRRALVVDLEVPTAGVVFFRNLDTDTTTILPANANRAVLSGDGSWVAVTDICDAPCLNPSHLVPTGGSESQPITTDCYFEVSDITADGRYAVGVRTSIGPEPCPGVQGVFRWDRVAKQLTKVPVRRDDLVSSGSESSNLRISNDGRFVSFLDTRTIAQVVDMLTGRTIVVDTDFLGRPRPVTGDATTNLSLSGDGRYVAFQTTGANTPGDTNGLPDVFTRYAIQPAITSLSPRTVARGAHVTLQVGGSEYLTGVDAFFGDGSGITVDGITLVSPERVDVTVTVAPDAPTGPVDLWVRNIGGFGESRAWCPGCITVT